LFLEPLHQPGETRASEPAKELLRSVDGQCQANHKTENEESYTHGDSHESCSFQQYLHSYGTEWDGKFLFSSLTFSIAAIEQFAQKNLSGLVEPVTAAPQRYDQHTPGVDGFLLRK